MQTINHTGGVCSAPPEVQIAWAAGLFEGEGSVWMDKGRTRIGLETTDSDVAGHFWKIVGAGTARKRKTVQEPHHKPSWRWQCGKLDDVGRILNLLFPYLGSRRQRKIIDCLTDDRRLK